MAQLPVKNTKLYTFPSPPGPVSGDSGYLGHVDEAQREGLVAQNGAVLVPLPPLQHDLQSVCIPLQEVRILRSKRRVDAVDSMTNSLKVDAATLVKDC